MPVTLISKIKPQNNAPIPMYDDVDGYGGYQVRSDTTDRDSIPTLNRKAGMLVYTQQDAVFWQLGAGLTNSDWIVAPLGGNIFFSGDLSGNPLMQFVVGLQGRPLSGAAPNNGDVIAWDALDGYWAPKSISGGGGLIVFSQDLSGDQHAQTVIGLQDRALSNAAPADGDVITWDAADGYWKPVSLSNNPGGGTVTFAGDLSGTNTHQIVTGLQGHPVSNTSPTDGYVLTWDAADGYWHPAASQGGSSTPTPPNYIAGTMSAVTYSAAQGRLSPFGGTTYGDAPVAIIIQVTGTGIFQIEASVSYTHASQSVGWALTMITGSFTINGSSANGFYSGVDHTNISGGTQTDLEVTPVFGNGAGTNDISTMTATIATGLTVGTTVGFIMQMNDFVGDPNFTFTFGGTNPNPPGTMLVMELGTGAAGGGGGSNATALQSVPIISTPPTDGQVLTYVAADGKWEPVTPSGGGGTLNTITSSEAIPTNTPSGSTIYSFNDAGNFVLIEPGVSGVTTGGQATFIVTNDGTNINPASFLVPIEGTPGSPGSLLSNSGRITTQWGNPGGTAPPTGGTIFVPYYVTSGSGGAAFGSLCIVKIRGTVPGSGSGPSWVYIVDTDNPGSPTNIFTHGASTAPTFGTTFVNNGTGLTITFNDTSISYYTVSVDGTSLTVVQGI